MTRAAWWLIAAGACREAVERLGGLTVEEARAAATEDELAWAMGGGYGGGCGGGGGGGDGEGSGFSCNWYTCDGGGAWYGYGFGGGYGYGFSGGYGDGAGYSDGGGAWYGYGFGGGYGDGAGYGGSSGSIDIISITIDGETMTPAEARERVRQWAE